MNDATLILWTLSLLVRCGPLATWKLPSLTVSFGWRIHRYFY